MLKTTDLTFRKQENYSVSAEDLERILEDHKGIISCLRSSQRDSSQKNIEVARLISLQLGETHLIVTSEKGTINSVAEPLFTPTDDSIYIPVCHIHTHVLPGVIPSGSDLESCFYRGVRRTEQHGKTIWFWDSLIHIITNENGNCFCYQQPISKNRLNIWKSIQQHKGGEEKLRRDLKGLPKNCHQEFYEELANRFHQQGYNCVYASMKHLDKQDFCERFSYSGYLKWDN